MDIAKEIEKHLLRLKEERFNERLNAAYGITKDKADSRIAGIGFDAAENRLGWTTANLNWILNNYQAVEKTLKDAEEIRSRFKYIIFCGMGGSGLSVQLVKDTFSKKGPRLYSLRTTDPKAIKEILDEIAALESGIRPALEKALVVAVSKSGTTQETVSHKGYFERLYAKFSLDVKKHLWVITDKGSPMDTGDYPQREIQLNSRGDIGGRFTSPTTNVFLLPLAIAAPERVKIILETAKAMNEVPDEKEDIFLKLGVYLYQMAAHQGKDKLTMLVPEELKDIPMWAEQLLEESLGKDGKGAGLFYEEKLSGPELRPADKNDRVFLRINISGKKTEQELWKYLEQNKYPLFEIELKDVNCIGGLMLGLQRAVAAVGWLWDICFVDQPAVEGYKKATQELMKSGQEVKVPQEWKYASFKGLKLYYSPLIQAGAITEQQLAEEVKRLKGALNDAVSVYAAIVSILSAQSNFEAAELTFYGRMNPGFKKVLDEARYSFFTRGLKIASKLGEGPDKNHSYHQNIEAGKDMWFSTYFMAQVLDQPLDLEFEPNLLKAQGIGTVRSIINNRRRVVLISLENGGKEQELKEFWDKVLAVLSAAGIIKAPLNTVSYEEFRKIDIRIATILEAAAHPNADKLYLLKIDIGDSQRQIVAGIRGSYKPEELVGRQIAVITNLEPAVIRGIKSEGMLLAASDEKGVTILSPQRPAKAGSVVK